MYSVYVEMKKFIMRYWKPIFYNSLLLFGSIVFSFLLAEIFIRIFVPQDLIVPMPAQADRELIYCLPANTKSYLKGTSVRWFHLETNSLGLRDSEHHFKKNPGTYRVLLLGDSMSMAEGVELEETYIKQFDKLANHRSEGEYIETINMAIRGYGNDQEVILFERIGQKFHPDLVILAFYERNDFDDNRRGGIFKLDGEKLIKTIPTIENSPKLWYYSRQIKIQNFPGYRFFIGHSHLLNLARNYFAGYLTRKSLAISEKHNETENKNNEEPRISLEDWMLTIKILERWIAGSLQIDSIPLLLFIPTYENIVEGKGKILENNLRIDTQLEKFVKSKNIHWINPSDTFTHILKPENLYLEDRHLSPEGHRIVADEILRYLVRNRDHLYRR